MVKIRTEEQIPDRITRRCDKAFIATLKLVDNEDKSKVATIFGSLQLDLINLVKEMEKKWTKPPKTAG